MLSPLYMAEISPPEVRGSLMVLEQFAIVLGVVAGFWIGFLTRSCMYRLHAKILQEMPSRVVKYGSDVFSPLLI